MVLCLILSKTMSKKKKLALQQRLILRHEISSEVNGEITSIHTESMKLIILSWAQINEDEDKDWLDIMSKICLNGFCVD